jgi:sulfide:quinone oxidoreductase
VRGTAPTYAWAQIAADQDARLVIDALVAADTAAQVVFTHGGLRLDYDILALATGARRVEPFGGAVTFGTSVDAAPRLRAVIADLLARDDASIAFALPSPSSWPLPLYELALLAAHELREHGSSATVRIVTPEEHPLGLFGEAAREAVSPLLEALDIELLTGVQPREVLAGGLLLDDGAFVAADHVVTIADIVARPIPGLPTDRAGFVPVDLHGRVTGEPAVYAAGEATSFPLRQGGLATQQADAVAEAIAAACGACDAPAPFEPILRGRLLTSGAPLFFQSGLHLAPYLCTARPPRPGATMAELVPAVAFAERGENDAVTLACALAEAESRCGNTVRALQAREAAQTLGRDRHAAV